MATTREPQSEFEREAQSAQPGLVVEFWDFLKHNKKWWLLPIVLVMLMLGGLVFLASTPLGPFIYTMF